MPASASQGSKVLYWKHSDNDAGFAAEPTKTDEGPDYVPVFDDQEADFAQASPKDPPKGCDGS